MDYEKEDPFDQELKTWFNGLTPAAKAVERQRGEDLARMADAIYTIQQVVGQQRSDYSLISVAARWGGLPK